jgi:hypothetical protein
MGLLMTKRTSRVAWGLMVVLAGILVIAAELAFRYTVDIFQVGNVLVMSSDCFCVGYHSVQTTDEPAPWGYQVNLGFVAVVVQNP